MKKFLFTVILLIAILTSFFAGFAVENEWFQAEKVEQEIIFNEETWEFESPVVKINDRIYVPLRETANKLGIDVGWFGEDEPVFVDGYFEEVLDIRKKAEELWGFSLPPTAVFLNYDYLVNQCDSVLRAQISFEKEDFEDIKENLLGIENIKWYEFPPNMLFDGSYASFDLECNYYSWWIMPTKENLITAYQSVYKGKRIRTRYSTFYIVESDDTYQLYIKFYKVG